MSTYSKQYTALQCKYLRLIFKVITKNSVEYPYFGQSIRILDGNDLPTNTMNNEKQFFVAIQFDREEKTNKHLDATTITAINKIDNNKNISFTKYTAHATSSLSLILSSHTHIPTHTTPPSPHTTHTYTPLPPHTTHKHTLNHSPPIDTVEL